MSHTFYVSEQSELAQIANVVAKRISDKNLCVFLEGDLGAGKTTWMRYYLGALGHQGPVVSPTYTVLEIYQTGDVKVVHSDCYRLGDDDLYWLDFPSHFESGTVCQLWIEWGLQFSKFLPPCDLLIKFRRVDDEKREMIFSSPAQTLDCSALFANC